MRTRGEVVLAVRGEDAAMYVAHLLMGEGVSVRPVGGNRLRVAEGWRAVVGAEVAGEVDASLRSPSPAASPPADQGEAGAAAMQAPPAPECVEPPRSGTGSGRDVWAAYAVCLGLDPADLGRDDIIELTEAHGGR